MRRTALLVGFALGVGYVGLQSVPATSHLLPAQVSVTTARAAELVASPPTRIIPSSPLRAGRAAGIRGAVTLRNPTDVALRVRPRSRRPAGELDRLLRIRIASGGKTIFNGGLDGLRAGSASRFRIIAGGHALVRVDVWLPASADAHEGRVADIALEWSTDVGR